MFILPDVHIRLPVSTLDNVRAAVDIGAIPRCTVIFHLVTVGPDTVAMTVARLVAASLPIALTLATITALASTLLVVATVLVFTLTRLVTALAVLVAAALLLVEAFVVRDTLPGGGGHGDQSEEEEDDSEAHDDGALVIELAVFGDWIKVWWSEYLYR